MPLILYAGFFPLWIAFYALGVTLRERERKYDIKWLIFLSLLALLLQLFESYYLDRIGGVGFGIKPSSFLFSYIVILLLFSKKAEGSYTASSIVYRIITWIGELSFGIYLTHYLLIRFVIEWLSLKYTWITDWLLTLCFSILIVIVMKKILPERYHKYIGV